MKRGKLTRKICILVFCALFVFLALVSAETDNVCVATIGNFTVTRDMINLYRLQDEAAKAVLEEYGLSAPWIDKSPLLPQTAESWLMTVCAAAQAGLNAGLSVSAEEVEGIVNGELISYSVIKGQEYLAAYAGYVTGKFEGTQEELMAVAVSIRTIQMLAEQYIAHKMNDRFSHVPDEETARGLANELAAIPAVRGNGEFFEPSIQWLKDTIALQRSFP